jgi:hypothetical protein
LGDARVMVIPRVLQRSFMRHVHTKVSEQVQYAFSPFHVS